MPQSQFSYKRRADVEAYYLYQKTVLENLIRTPVVDVGPKLSRSLFQNSTEEQSIDDSVSDSRSQEEASGPLPPLMLLSEYSEAEPAPQKLKETETLQTLPSINSQTDVPNIPEKSNEEEINSTAMDTAPDELSVSSESQEPKITSGKATVDDARGAHDLLHCQ